MSLVLLLH